MKPHADNPRAPSVLVIDDDPVIRMVVREALEGAGMSVVEADDAESALAQAAAIRPEVTILDIMLPRIDGLTMLASIVEAAAGTSVLVFSATGSRSAERALSMGASDYMSKPFELRTLVQRVQQLLDARAAAA
jgi:DNA-binding response OmpR family regulator